MQKYIVGHTVHGYDTIDADSFESAYDLDGSIVIMVVSKETDEQLHDYYNLASKLVKKDNRVMLIGANDGNASFKPLASLLVNYDAYDIYTVESIDRVNSPYLSRLEDRSPDISEIKNFIGGDIVAYDELSTLLFGIESLAESGNIEGLKEFIETHMQSIENVTTTINGMKKKCDMFNSGELFKKIAELQEEVKDFSNQSEQNLTKFENERREREKLSVELKKLSKDVAQLTKDKEELSNTDGYSSNAITSYKEINTQLISCKTQLIIYFKEISYVNYTNTLITQLMNKLNLMKLNTKLIIYDTRTSLYNTYKPLNVINGKKYTAEKDNVINKYKQFVVSEPSNSILEDILTSSRAFDVVVLYDRMKEPVDMISGNNVTKFYVVNSSKDFNEVKNTIKINDMSNVITQPHSSIEADSSGKRFLDIPRIEGYANSTDSAKLKKYSQLVTSTSNVNIINDILEKSKVKAMFAAR